MRFRCALLLVLHWHSRGLLVHVSHGSDFPSKCGRLAFQISLRGFTPGVVHGHCEIQLASSLQVEDPLVFTPPRCCVNLRGRDNVPELQIMN